MAKINNYIYVSIYKIYYIDILKNFIWGYIKVRIFKNNNNNDIFLFDDNADNDINDDDDNDDNGIGIINEREEDVVNADEDDEK